jgi:hypothetical protein
VSEVTIDGDGDSNGSSNRDDGVGMEWEVNGGDIKQIVIERYEMWK